MKMNLKKSLVAITISSTSVAIIGISFFIVGGYGNNISSLSEIQNSGFFGVNTAFTKEKTISYNSKNEYVNYLKENLELEAAKINSTEYNKFQEEIIFKENEIIEIQKNEIQPLKDAITKAQNNFNNDRTVENKKILNDAKQQLIDSPANTQIDEAEIIIDKNNKFIVKVNQSKDDILRLNNYLMWNSLFITGATLLAIGSIIAITSTSYSIYLKKKQKNMATK